jgi:dTDP-4-dehydrorhamnose reductase
MSPSTSSSSALYDRVLIIGNRGMLAHTLNATLAGRGVTAHGVDRAECDVTDPKQVAALFDRVRPTLVFNCAAYTAVDKCETETATADAVNGHAVGHLAAEAKKHSAALVHYSTDFVFDGTASRPYTPADPTNPLSAYGRSKLLGEQQLQANAPARWLICRTAWLYGPNGASFPKTMVNAARAGKPLKVVSDQRGSPTYTFHLAATTLALLDAGAHGVWHTTNRGETTWFEFTKAILSTFGIDQPVAAITAADWKALRPESAHRPAYSVLDVTPIEKLTGKPAPTWQEGLASYRAAVGDAP